MLVFGFGLIPLMMSWMYALTIGLSGVASPSVVQVRDIVY